MSFPLFFFFFFFLYESAHFEPVDEVIVCCFVQEDLGTAAILERVSYEVPRSLTKVGIEEMII